MNRKTINSLFCAMMLTIIMISCNNDDGLDGLSPAETSGTYTNKLSAPANGDSLILSYNGNPLIGKDVKFKTNDGKYADIILKFVLPHDKQTAITNIPLEAAAGGYSFSGNATSTTGTTFHYRGSIEAKRLVLDLSDITIPDNRLATNGTWHVAHANATYYNVDNGSIETMIGMLYNLIGGKLVGNLISSVLDNLTFRADGNIIARYAPLPDSVRIGSLIGNYVKHSADDWIASPLNLATYYVENDTYLYVIPQIDMIIRQVTINKQTKAGSGENSAENALAAAYQKLNTWSTTGIRISIRESEDPAKGDLILMLDKSEIQELFVLPDIVKAFIPEEKLNAPVMDLIGEMIPPQFAGIAGILLKGKTLGSFLEQLGRELNAIPIEIGIYLYKDKPVDSKD